MPSPPRNPGLARNALANSVSFAFHSLVGFFLSPFVVRHLGDTAWRRTLLAVLVGYLGLVDVRPEKTAVFSGSQSRGVRARGPVAGCAGPRETGALKPIDNTIGTDGKRVSRAATCVNAGPPSKDLSPGGRAHIHRAKAAWRVAVWLTRRSTPAGRERRHGDEDTASNWRSPVTAGGGRGGFTSGKRDHRERWRPRRVKWIYFPAQGWGKRPTGGRTAARRDRRPVVPFRVGRRPRRYSLSSGAPGTARGCR